MFKSTNLNSKIFSGNSEESSDFSDPEKLGKRGDGQNLHVEPVNPDKIPRGRCSKGKKAKRLDYKNIDLSAEFERRNIKIQDFVDYCSILGHGISYSSAQKNIKKNWCLISTIVQVKFLAFFHFIDRVI